MKNNGKASKYGKNSSIIQNNTENENLGLDADHSSEDLGRLNNDGERISQNPDGEDDDHDTEEPRGSSPLMDK